MKIYLDMDGTIADLYADKEWLAKIENRDPSVYANAKRLVEEEVLLNLIAKGYELGIVSWLAGGSNKEYDKEVRRAKKEWLARNYPRVEFKEVHIVKYGRPKYSVVRERNAVLVDDEERNRVAWLGKAIEPKELVKL